MMRLSLWCCVNTEYSVDSAAVCLRGGGGGGGGGGGSVGVEAAHVVQGHKQEKITWSLELFDSVIKNWIIGMCSY